MPRAAFPPGHFYSPIPSLPEVKLREKEIFERKEKEIPGINLNEEGQLHLLHKLSRYYAELPFEVHKKQNLRYCFENPFFSYADAIVLYCMIRHLLPKRIIEIGSGYSSCVILDTNELFLGNTVACTFIEPHPDQFLSLTRPSDRSTIQLIRKQVQDIEVNKFSELSTGDILFIDSSHVSKVGSDVNYIFFEMLPRIERGVYVHFHDIFHAFEYPKEWVYEGRAWNEAYVLRGFLQYNNAFEIVFFNDFLATFRRKSLFTEMPLCEKNTGGSIWIRRI